MKRYALLASLVLMASCQDAMQNPTAVAPTPEGVIPGSDLIQTPSGAAFTPAEWASIPDTMPYLVPAADRVAAHEHHHGTTAEAAAPRFSVTGGSGPKVLCHTNAFSCAQIPAILPGSSVVYWNDSQWNSATVATFSQFDAIYIHDSAATVAAIVNSKNVWGSATTGRVALTGVHFEHCTAGTLSTGPCRVFKASMDWIHAGTGTGLLMSTQASNVAAANALIPSVAPYAGVTFSAAGGGWDLVRVTDPGHATMQGSTDATLSNFSQSSHSLFANIGGMTSVAEICSISFATYPGACAGGTWLPHYLVASVGVADQDGDGVGDLVDNCPTVGNANQADVNGNGVGDVCESAPSVTISPKTVSIALGGSVTFTAVAEDTDNALSSLTYVWRVDGVVVPGSSSTLTRTFAQDAVVRVTVRDPGNLSGFDEATVEVQTDNTAPVITANVVGTLGENGWYTSNVSVSFSVADAESSVTNVVNCGPQTVTADTDGVTFTCTATSAGGTANKSVTIKRDASAPTLVPDVSGTLSPTGWYTSDVVIDWNYADDVSGVIAGPTCNAVTLGADTSGSTFSCTVTNGAGAEVTSQVVIKRDASEPVITASVLGPQGDNGWYTGIVNVSFDVQDESPFTAQGCEAQVVSSNTAGTTFVCTATSAGGTATKSVTVKRDATEPSVSPVVAGTQGVGGWFTSNVNVSWTSADDISGVTEGASCVTRIVSSDTQGVTYACTVTNGAGFQATEQVTIKRDASAPTLTGGVSGLEGDNGWYTSNVSVGWNYGDEISGVTAGPTCVNTTLSNDTGSITYACTVTNGAGLESTEQVTIKRDASAPTLTGGVSGLEGNNGWYTSNVSVGWNYGDGISGVTAGPTCANTTLSTDTGSITYACTVTNGAGLETTEQHIVKRDATPPVVSFAGNTVTYTVDQAVAITCSATDALSGIASSTCAPISGAASSFNLGTNSYSATAFDRAGNSTTTTTTFTVGVTRGSICELVERFVSNKGIANSMCGQIEKGNVNAFVNHVQAQSGKSLTASNAALLIRLARAL